MLWSRIKVERVLSMSAFVLGACLLAAGRNTVSQLRFEDVAAKSGVDFVLHNFPTQEKHMIETMAGGLAVFDYDRRRPAGHFLYERRSDTGIEEIVSRIFQPVVSQRRRTAVSRCDGRRRA